jgi:hypothetical protein
MPSNKSSSPDSVPGKKPSEVQKEREEMTKVASLAVRLLASCGPAANRSEQISAALRTARVLIAEAEKHPQIHACDLFEPHQVMSVKDIAQCFKEHDWSSLSSEGSVKKRAIEILTALHHDIQRRSNLLNSAFQQLHRNINPEHAEREAARHIRELLERLGMSSAFGDGITQAVTNTWQRLLEEWLGRVLSAREQIEQTRKHTPEYFESICPDLNYSDFCASLRPPADLCSDDLLNLGLWLNHDFRKRLTDRQVECSNELDGLATLNHWPECIFPYEPDLAKPFAAFLSSIKADYDEASDDLKNFDRGIIRLSMLISRMRMKELSELIQQPRAVEAPGEGKIAKNAGKAGQAKASKQAKIKPPEAEAKPWVAPLERFQEIRSKFWALTEEQKTSLDETFFSDITVMVDAAVEFLATGRLVTGMAKYPWNTYMFRNPLLKTYATSLYSLHRYFKEQDRLFTDLGVDKAELIGMTSVIDQEMETVNNLNGELKNAGDHLSKRLDEGRKLFEALVFKAPSPGRIRPYLLFAYARDSKSLKDPKLMDLLHHRLTTGGG